MIDTDLYKAKKLYPFQENTVNQVLDELRTQGSQFNLLYQLPTGGGKTVIFSAIAKQYIKEWKKRVLILTHRIELSIQTSKQLQAIGVNNKVISSEVKTIEDQTEYDCYIAMVETLNNRLQDNKEFIEDVGLVIVDEAHLLGLNNGWVQEYEEKPDERFLGTNIEPKKF
jgi:superfamily II DNA or RNA helicase